MIIIIDGNIKVKLFYYFSALFLMFLLKNCIKTTDFVNILEIWLILV